VRGSAVILRPFIERQACVPWSVACVPAAGNGTYHSHGAPSALGWVRERLAVGLREAAGREARWGGRHVAWPQRQMVAQ